MTDEPAGYATFRGGAEWASKVLGRQLTFKQMSRNVVITKLANSPNLSAYDAAAYMGIQPRTIQNYHKTSATKRAKACEILNVGESGHVWGRSAHSGIHPIVPPQEPALQPDVVDDMAEFEVPLVELEPAPVSTVKREPGPLVEPGELTQAYNVWLSHHNSGTIPHSLSGS